MNRPSIDPRKAALVAEFLKDAFPGRHVHDVEEFDRDCWYYRVDQSGAGGVMHRLRVSREFLDDHTEDGILQRLRGWQVPDVLRQAGPRSVLVSNTGCVIEAER